MNTKQVSQPGPSGYDDEISLIDIWLVLVKKKRIFLFVFVILLILSSLVILLKPHQYGYSATMEIGTRFEKDTSLPIEPPEAVIAKLSESYIPMVVKKHAINSSESKFNYKLQARAPKNSGVIIIAGEGPMGAEEGYLGLLKEINALVAKDHKRITDLQRANIGAELRSEQIKLDGLKDPITLENKRRILDVKINELNLTLETVKDPILQRYRRQALQDRLEETRSAQSALKSQSELITSRITRLDETERLLQAETEGLKSQIQSVQAARLKAAGETTTEPQAMTLLMLDSDLQRNRTRLFALEERLFVELKGSREELKKEITDNQRASEIQSLKVAEAEGALEQFEIYLKRDILEKEPGVAQAIQAKDKMLADHERAVQQQTQVVKTIKQKLDFVFDTRTVLAPNRSLRAKGPNRLLLLVLAGILALIGALVAAFISSFFDKARELAASV